MFNFVRHIAIGALIFASTTASAATPDTALEAAIAQSHRALHAILNGDPSVYAALFADRDDVTLGNPFGPFAKGKPAVVKTLSGAAANYRDGDVIAVDRVAQYSEGNIVALVEVEHDRAKVGKAAEAAEFSARVTSVYEKFGSVWKLVHRHADPITSPRPAESVLAK